MWTFNELAALLGGLHTNELPIPRARETLANAKPKKKPPVGPKRGAILLTLIEEAEVLSIPVDISCESGSPGAPGPSRQTTWLRCALCAVCCVVCSVLSFHPA